MSESDRPAPDASIDSAMPEFASTAAPVPAATPSSMEIHAPEHPVHTWRDFLRHIVIVTVGILIALSLEGLLEWRHHRAIVREARENIRREIAGNLENVRKLLADQERAEREIADLLAFIDASPGSRPKPEGFFMPLKLISAASWNSAQVTGAVTYMSFDEVQGYAAVYDLQQHFGLIQQQLLRDSILIGSAPNLDKPAPGAFESWREQIKICRASYHAELQFAESLVQLYQRTLEERPAEQPAPVHGGK
jgi:hypothetical protein